MEVSRRTSRRAQNKGATDNRPTFKGLARKSRFATNPLLNYPSIMRQLEESSDNTGNRELEPGKSFFVDSPIGTADSTDGVSTAGSPGKDVNGGARLRAETKLVKSHISMLNMAVLQDNLDQVRELASAGVKGADECGKTPLHRALEKQNIEMAQIFIRQGIDVNALDNREESPLHTAVRTGNVTTVKALLTEDVDVNICGPGTQIRPLHLAAQLDQNSAQICKMLLNSSADPFVQDSSGMTPIAYAAQKGFTNTMECFFQHVEMRAKPDEKEKMTKKLLSNVDDKGSSLLYFAVASRQIEAVDLSLSKGSLAHEKRNDGTTAVHVACMHGPFECLERILRSLSFIFDYSLADNGGNTCLHRAAQFNQAQTVDFLLSQKIDINPTDRKGQTPLMLAVRNGCNQAIQVLLDKGADVTMRDNKKKTVLHAAIGHPETLALLLQFEKIGALVEMKDKSGNTALHYAAGKGRAQEAELLVKYRPNLATKKNDRGDKPLHLAARNGYLDIAYVLLEEDIPSMINVLDLKERSPVHLAAFGGHVEIVEYLLQRGASIQKDQDGQTPLHYAATNGSLETVQLLLRANSACLNVVDKKERSALHLAAVGGHAHIVEFLLSIREQEVRTDSMGDNVLDLAIEHQRGHVAMTLAEHKRWKEVFLPQSEGPSQMERLVEKMPDVAERFLDRCVKRENREKSSDNKITYDLRFLQGMTGADNHRKPQNSLKAIYAMVKHKRLRCLNHETTVALINLKWRKYGLWLVLVNQIMSFLYLIAVICLITTLQDNPCYGLADKTLCDNSTLNGDPEWPKRPQIVGYEFLVWILLGLSGFKILKQCFHIYNMGRSYIRQFAYVMELMLGVAMSVFLLPEGCAGCYGAGAVAACLAWFSLIIRLSEVTFLGIYVMMMSKIFETVSKVFLLLFMFILCFGFSFFVLNFQQDLFGDLPQSLVTTFIMMMGEMNYNDIFLGEGGTKHPGIMYPLYILFCLCMPIIFLNFLIGLAVGDIESIQKEAAVQRHSVQVRQLHSIENSFPKFCLKYFEVGDKCTVLRNPSTAKPLKTRMFDLLVGTMATMMGKRRNEGGDEAEEIVGRQNARLKEISNLVEFHTSQLQHLRGFLRVIEESVENLENPKARRKQEIRLKSLKASRYRRTVSS